VRSGAVVRFGYPQEPATLDPLAAGGGSSATRDILRPVLPALFALDADLKPEPELAAAWPRRTDFAFEPFTVRLRLRVARWSDNKPITASDVRFSWTKLREGPTGYRYRHLRDVEVLGPRELRMHFDQRMRRWWALFSIDDMVLPQHAYSEQWDRGPTVSGGPFFVDDWTDGLRIRLKRNERYWSGVVPLAGIDVVFVPDDETRLQLLERGELDGFFAEGGSNMGRRAVAHGFPSVDEALEGDAGSSGTFGPAWWELDLDPARVGQAVAKAVVEALDPKLAAEILEDSGRAMNDIPADFTADRRVPTPWSGRGGLSEAVATLDAGGVPHGVERATFQLAFPRLEGGPGIAQFVHFRLREIGVTAELVGLEPDSFEKSWVPQGKAPAMLRLRRGADAPDAAAYAAASKLPGSAPSSSMDGLVAQAESLISNSRLVREPAVGLAPKPWGAVETELVRTATASPLVRTRSTIAAAAGLTGPRAVGAANGPLWNAVHWSMEPSA
jgi:ABC-type transport system substrate-binding protein